MLKPEQAQAAQAATPEPASKGNDVKDSTQQDPKAEAPKEPFKVFSTQEEYDASIKSEASKQKNDWLKENNLKSVDEYRAEMAKYEEAIKAKETQDASIKDLQEKLDKSHEEILARDLGVAPEHKDDLMILAKAKVTKDVSLEQAAKAILDATPSWKGANPQPRIGVERSDHQAPAIGSNEDLIKKFPWLR